MAQVSQDPSTSVQPGAVGEGDQSMGTAFKFRDNKAVDGTAHAAHRVTGHTKDRGRNTTEEPSAGYENITRTEEGFGDGPSGVVNTDGKVEVMCGPLLNYKRMSNLSGKSIWHGSVLIVTKPLGRVQPSLTMKYAGAVAAKPQSTMDGAEESKLNNTPALGQIVRLSGLKLYEDPDKAFWRFLLEVPFQDHECTWEYSLPNIRFLSGKSARTSSSRTFVVPAANESMRIMFHSCNGFSVGTDEDAWSGTALWNDVLRVHGQKPFHVMIGGGDQIYNDGVRVGGPLKGWADIGNPKKRREYLFPEKLRDECDKYYFDNYVKWFSAEPFAGANSIIPQVNIWDDHGKLCLLMHSESF